MVVDFILKGKNDDQNSQFFFFSKQEVGGLTLSDYKIFYKAVLVKTEGCLQDQCEPVNKVKGRAAMSLTFVENGFSSKLQRQSKYKEWLFNK